MHCLPSSETFGLESEWMLSNWPNFPYWVRCRLGYQFLGQKRWVETKRSYLKKMEKVATKIIEKYLKDGFELV